MGLARWGFEKLRVLGESIAIANARRDFTHDLNVVIETFGANIARGSHERVFRRFKSEYEDQKHMFETTDMLSSRLGWTNFLDLISFSTQELDEDNCFDIDTLHAMAIQNSIHKLKKTWDKIPFELQKEIDETGILFEGYSGVLCTNFVFGIHNAARSKDIRASIVTHKVSEDAQAGLAAPIQSAQSRQQP